MILCVSNRLAFIFLLVVSYCGMSFSAWANPDLPVVDPLGVRSGISSITTNSAQTAMTINTNSAQSLQDFRTFVSSVSQSGTLQRSSGQGTLTLLTSPTGRISILNRGTATRPESIIWNDTINLYTGSGGITIAKPVSTTQGQVNAFFNATQLSSVSYLGKSFQFADRLLGGVITGGNTSRATVQYQEYTGGPLGSVRGATGQPLQLWTRI